MLIPRHWAEFRIRHREGNRQWTVRRFGWSDVGAGEAAQHAEARAREALAHVVAGEALPRREPKLAYGGDGLPIREEIVAEHGTTVITRNAYGALCLNTPDVLFADVDFADVTTDWSVHGCSLAFVTSAIVGLVLKVVGPRELALVMAVFAMFATPLLVEAARRVSLRARGGPEAIALDRVRRFVARRPEWRLEVYRTPLGLRLLALHAHFDAASPEVAACFDELRVDRSYARMCSLQQCFRARVTPKPWRIGMTDHLRPRPGVWPVDPKWLPLRERWLAEYERKRVGYAACRHVESLGSGAVDPHADEVRRLHDELSNARSDASIA